MKANLANKITLNIAMFGQKRIPSREGGIEIVVEELATRMVQNGHKVTCINRSGHHVNGKEYDNEKVNEYRGIQIKRVPTIQKKGIAAFSSSFFAAVSAAFGKYDIVHIHAEGPGLFCWIPKLAGKKVVISVHGLDHERAKWNIFGKKAILMGEKNIVKYADEIIVLSQNIQNYFMEKYGRKTRFIPNGVNKPILKDIKEISKWGLEKDGYLLYLGRIVPEKGEEYLIKAFKQVKADKKLVIAGGSSDTDSFLNKLKLLADNDERIIFTGFVQGRKLEELYSNAYIYILPSDLEGMPLSLLEGMSYGNCCLTSDIAECTEVIEDKAVTFKKSNVNDLKEKLQWLCDKPEAVERYKNKAADFILKKYSWDDVVDKTIQIYRGKF